MEESSEKRDMWEGSRPFRQGLGASSASRAGAQRRCGRRGAAAQVAGPLFVADLRRRSAARV